MRKLLVILVLMVGMLANGPAWAITVYLTNGDRISGTVSSEDEHSLILHTAEAGDIKLDKTLVDMHQTFPDRYHKAVAATAPKSVMPKKTVQWKKNLALGYTQQNGNTNQKQGSLTAELDRKTLRDEAMAKLTALYSMTNGKIDTKKFYSLLRYAYSFGANLKWYNFYKLEGSQDRFAGIDYRIIPSLGRGYWFSNTDNWKAMAEMAVGYQYTNYNTGIKSNGEVVLVPRFMVDKRLVKNLHASEDFTFYPSLADIHDYRLRSETDLINQITVNWAFKFQFIDEFNSNPMAVGVKKNDETWLTSLQYSF